jgi:hypothetical protein
MRCLGPVGAGAAGAAAAAANPAYQQKARVAS